MHSNNVLRNIFSHNQDIGMIISIPTDLPPILFISNKRISCIFFPPDWGFTNIICTVPIS